MPNPRQYPERLLTPAEKQARHRQKKEAEADRLRGLLHQLERAVWQAADRGDGLADIVKSTTVETMLEKLTGHFDSIKTPNG